MDFRDQVKSNLKSKKQLAAEDKQRHKELLYRAAEYNYAILKRDILAKAAKAEHKNGRITGLVHMEHGSSYDDYVPYSERLFEAEYKSKSKRYGGIFVYWDIDRLSLKINNMSNLLAVHDIMKKMAADDKIAISEPFLHVEVVKIENRKLIRDKKVRRLAGKLSASVRYRSYIGRKGRAGQDATIKVAVEYSYKV